MHQPSTAISSPIPLSLRAGFLLCFMMAAGLAAAPALSGAKIETIAGGGGLGDGGPATQARLSLPGGLLFSPQGDLVIVDFGNHRIRRVHQDGRIETVAGTGQPGFGGDGGPAGEARLARPENAAFGPQGDLFIVDSHNHRIRRMDWPSGRIETVAGTGRPGFAGDGGPAAQAGLYQPEGIAFDSRGNYYIGDTLNNRIRKVSPDGIITSVAGCGEIGVSADNVPAMEAKFMRLARLAVDHQDRLLIADSPSQTIQRLDPQTGRLTVVAGVGVEGFSGDGGPARRARLSYPEGLALDSLGNIYFADLGNHRVRRIDRRSGIITTVAGSGQRGFSGDGGPALKARLWSPGRIALDPQDDLYIADILNARVRQVDSRGGTIRTVAGSGDLGDGGSARQAVLAIPGDLTVMGDRLYVAEFGNRRVRKIDLNSLQISTLAGGGVGAKDGERAQDLEFKLPEAIQPSADRRSLYVSDSLDHRIWRIDLTTGTAHLTAGTGVPGDIGDGGPARLARLNRPGALAVLAEGSLVVSDFGNRRLRVIDPASGIIRPFPPKEGDAAKLIPALALFARGDFLYWSMTADAGVYRLDLASGKISRKILQMTYRQDGFQLADLAATSSEVLVADTLSHRIVRLDLENGLVEAVVGTGLQGFSGDGGTPLQASLFRPGAVAVGPKGRIFVADTFNHRIRQVTLAPGREVD